VFLPDKEYSVCCRREFSIANDTLDTAYTDGSATLELIPRLLGKKDNLVIEIRKLRKTSKPKSKTNGAD
jgi:hypothetical protein